MFHATSRRHLMSQLISPRTTTFYIWHHITPQSASHHHLTPPHLKAQHIRHRIATVHISHPQRLHTTPTFNIAVHSTFHTTSDLNRNTLHLFPHLTIAQHIAYATFFITISHHIVIFHILHMQHSRTPHSKPRHPHHTFGRISITFNITSNHNHIRSRPLSAMNITFKYRLQLIRTTPQHTFQTTPRCISTIPYRYSTTTFRILHQHTTIFPMYHTIIQYRITIFHNASDIAHHTISHIFYIALYRTSQLH